MAKTTAAPIDVARPSAAHRTLGVGLAVAGTIGLLVLSLVIGQQHHAQTARYVLHQGAALALAALVVCGACRIIRVPPPGWEICALRRAGAGCLALTRARAAPG